MSKKLSLLLLSVALLASTLWVIVAGAAPPSQNQNPEARTQRAYRHAASVQVDQEQTPADAPLAEEDAPAHLKIMKVSFVPIVPAVYKKTEKPINPTLLEMEILRQHPTATFTRKKFVREVTVLGVRKNFRGDELVVSGTNSPIKTMLAVSYCSVNFKTEVSYTEVAAKDQEKELKPLVIAWGKDSHPWLTGELSHYNKRDAAGIAEVVLKEEHKVAIVPKKTMIANR